MLLTLFTPFISQVSTEIELKNELAKGNYESPYIVRPLEDITVNGVSIDSYSVVAPDGRLYSEAAETLCDEIYDACGKKLSVAENPNSATAVNATLIAVTSPAPSFLVSQSEVSPEIIVHPALIIVTIPT